MGLLSLIISFPRDPLEETFQLHCSDWAWKKFLVLFCFVSLFAWLVLGVAQ